MPASRPALLEGRDAASAAFESQRTREERRRGGIFNTPWSVAVEVASTIDEPGTVCDPSCGTGTLLLAAAERLVALGLSRRDAAASLVGIDVDAHAIDVARRRLAEWGGGDVARLVVADALTATAAAAGGVDHVVGNPPFVDRVHPRFLALGAAMARSTVAMIVPRSVLATDSARTSRQACIDAGFGVVSVQPVARVFDASVDACIVVLRRDAPRPTGATWSSLLVERDVPDVQLTGTPMADVAGVVAGFRQHFYGLRGHVREGGSGRPLVTSGSIEPASWGGRSVRFDGVRYDDPRVTVDDVDEPVRSWFTSLLRPKVLVATQTRVLEAAADERGEVIPSVPVISVVPNDPSMVWHLLAVLLAPPVTAWALRSWGGTALSARALKLGAPHVRAIPLPHASRAWDDAAGLLQVRGDVVGAGARMCEAFGVEREVHAWWADRLR